MTTGEKRVRVDFNVAGSGIVDDIKRRSAMMIDLVDSIAHFDPRNAALAMTAYEEAAMWAVKCATAQGALGEVKGPDMRVPTAPAGGQLGVATTFSPGTLKEDNK